MSDDMVPTAHAEDRLEVAVALSALTYRAVTDVRRRLAMLFLVIAVVFAALSLTAGALWAQTRSGIDDVVDDPLVEALGVEVPDPRPTVERGALRVKAALFGIAAVTSGVMAVITAALWALVRPPRAPTALLARATRDVRIRPESG